jgi:hypothetical protein
VCTEFEKHCTVITQHILENASEHTTGISVVFPETFPPPISGDKGKQKIVRH